MIKFSELLKTLDDEEFLLVSINGILEKIGVPSELEEDDDIDFDMEVESIHSIDPGLLRIECYSQYYMGLEGGMQKKTRR